MIGPFWSDSTIWAPRRPPAPIIRCTRQPRAPAPARSLAQTSPANADLAVLAIRWQHALDPATRLEYQQRLSYILQLAAAALGKIEVHGSLGRLLGVQRQEIAASSASHAEELRQRDQAVSEMRV